MAKYARCNPRNSTARSSTPPPCIDRNSHTVCRKLAYEIEHGKSGQPEIKGYSPEYLDASSPRRKQIEEHLAKENQRGAGAAQIAAHQTREAKIELSHEEMQSGTGTWHSSSVINLSV